MLLLTCMKIFVGSAQWCVLERERWGMLRVSTSPQTTWSSPFHQVYFRPWAGWGPGTHWEGFWDGLHSCKWHRVPEVWHCGREHTLSWTLVVSTGRQKKRTYRNPNAKRMHQLKFVWGYSSVYRSDSRVTLKIKEGREGTVCHGSGVLHSCQPQTKLSVAKCHVQSFLEHKPTCKPLVKHLFLVSQSKFTLLH